MYTELQRFLREKEVDVALFFNNDANLTYFAGVKPDIACLAVPQSGKPLLFVPGFEAERMAKSSLIDVVHVEKDMLGQVCGRFPAKRIGVVPAAVSYAQIQAMKSKWNADFVDIGEKCTQLRLVKTKNEIKSVTKACAITDALFEELCARIPSLKTELEAASFLKFCMAQLGFEPSFPAIVASGPNGAIPHHMPTHAKLSGFTVIDFGIVYKNYCSDITRTVFIGSPNAKDQLVYENLLKVQEHCIRKVMPGTKLEDIDETAHKLVGKTMIHRVGHSLGIEVHDVQPRPWTLQSGCILTIEPGTYLPGRLGIRIEDDVLVSEKGPVVLTQSSKDLLVFP